MDRLTISYLHTSIVFDDDASRSCWEGFADREKGRGGWLWSILACLSVSEDVWVLREGVDPVFQGKTLGPDHEKGDTWQRKQSLPISIHNYHQTHISASQVRSSMLPTLFL